MAYLKPGTYVEQIFLPPPRVTEQYNYLVGIIGTNYNVVEGDRAFAGRVAFGYDPADPTIVSLIADTDSVTFDYPNLNAFYDKILLSTVKVYLVPAFGTTGVSINHFTIEYEQQFGKRLSYVGPVADITDAVTITESGVTIPRWIIDPDAGRPESIVKLYNGFKFRINDLGKGEPDYPVVSVYIEYKAYRQPQGEFVETFNEANQVSFQLSHYPIIYPDPNFSIIKHTATGDIAITPVNIDAARGIVEISDADVVTDPATEYIRITYHIANPTYQSPVYIDSLDKAIELFGYPHPMNPVSFAIYLTYQVSDLPVLAMAIEPAVIGQIEPEMTKLSDKLYSLARDPQIYPMVVLHDAKEVAAILRDIFNEIEDFYDVNLFKISMVGYKNFDTASDGFASLNSEQAKEDIKGHLASFDDRRLRWLINPAIVVDFNKIDYIVSGYYYSAIYAAQISSMMNFRNGFPSKPMSLSEVPVVKDIYYPNNSPFFFTEDQLDELGDAGGWILTKDEGKVIVRHQLTTAESQLTTAEDSIVRAVDYVTLELKRFLKQFIGTRHLTQDLIDTVIKPEVNRLIEQWQQQEICAPGTKIEEIYIDPTRPDRLIMKIRYQPLYPVNAILITVVV